MESHNLNFQQQVGPTRMGELFEPTGVLSGAGQVVGTELPPIPDQPGPETPHGQPEGLLRPAGKTLGRARGWGGGSGGAWLPGPLRVECRVSGAREVVCKPRVRLPAWSRTPQPIVTLERESRALSRRSCASPSALAGPSRASVADRPLSGAFPSPSAGRGVGASGAGAWSAPVVTCWAARTPAPAPPRCSRRRVCRATATERRAPP